MSERYTGPPEIDHRLRATDLHRRAQKAEAAAQTANREAAHLLRAYEAMRSNRNTAKRKLSKARAQLRAVRMADPLTRIIELGRLFP